MARDRQSSNAPSVRISYSFLKILTGSDLSRRRLPLMSAVSVNPGPVVWLTACGHGDEICGIVIIQELFRQMRRRLLRGAVHAFPLMNPMGFETASRNITVSREDLNRSFPGEPTGSLGKRIANHIFSRILSTSPSLVLDLHNDWTKSIPYLLIDRVPANLPKAVTEKTEVFAKQTGFVVIVDTDEMTSTLPYNLLLNNVPAITLELGEPYLVNERNVEYGLGAIWNTLAYLEMIKPPEEPFSYPVPPAYSARRLLTYSDKPYSSQSGIIRFLAKPGDAVKKGQPFARIVNAFGKHQETVKALEDAIVLGHSDTSVVFPGMPIMAFGMT
jgi:predicted deacylase